MLNKWNVLTALALLSLAGMAYLNSNHYKLVTLSENSFECTATDSVGIDARCTQYTMRPLKKSLGTKPLED